MCREAEVNRAVDQYGDTIQRICMIHLKNHADTQDIFQEVFLKYALGTAGFEDERQEKAWLIRVAVNACRDLLKSFFRSRIQVCGGDQTQNSGTGGQNGSGAGQSSGGQGSGNGNGHRYGAQ